MFPSRHDIFDDEPGENWVGSPAMRRIQERLTKEKIEFKRPPLDSCIHATDLVKMMLAFDPNDRPSAADALHHEWFFMSCDGTTSTGSCPRPPINSLPISHSFSI